MVDSTITVYMPKNEKKKSHLGLDMLSKNRFQNGLFEGYTKKGQCKIKT